MLTKGEKTPAGQGPTRLIPCAADHYRTGMAQGIRHPANRRFGHHQPLARHKRGQIIQRNTFRRHAEMPRGAAQPIFQGAINKTLHDQRGAEW